MALQTPECRPSYYQFSPDKMRDFLCALAELEDVDLACQRIKVRRERIDEARRNDPGFRAAWTDTMVSALFLRTSGHAPVEEQ